MVFNEAVIKPIVSQWQNGFAMLAFNIGFIGSGKP
jgi:hypothetical protein